MEEKLSLMRSAFVDAGNSVLGFEHRKHPDWYRDSAEVLGPLLKLRNRTYVTWLDTHKAADRSKFVEARRNARSAVRKAKNTWFQEKAEEA